MKTRKIGRTSSDVFAIGFGAMPLSNVGRPPEADGIKVIHTALDVGINFIDTANVYCEISISSSSNGRGVGARDCAPLTLVVKTSKNYGVTSL